MAIVTSPTGAAIRDILNILSRRAPHLQVTVVPAIVQGESSAGSIRDGFQKALQLPNVNVVIVGRGGGSIEDLWGFNDEKLARMIAASPIPVISAVGHEIDFTIADFVADLRAPTPSAAAELVARSHQEIQLRLEQQVKLLSSAWTKKFSNLDQKVKSLSRLLVDPKRKLQDLILRNDDLVERLQLALQNLFKHKTHQVSIARERLKSPLEFIGEKKAERDLLFYRLAHAVKNKFQDQTHSLHTAMNVLNSLSPLRVVDRGYAMVMKKHNVMRSHKQIKPNDELTLILAEGEARVKVEEVFEQNILQENLWNSKKS